ncbi:hypothetical protein [uncultured Jannaschia sp.]|uniref:hypothetical protein n=1 Tax=uncultured Jannaschia sp. TaxID=293347 RepID=UPI002617B90A|nr:hypothetical protein [uncultured Jannaschia sp.]
MITTLAAAAAQVHAADQYFTHPETAALCLAHLAEVAPSGAVDLYLEPSAGAGAFLERLPVPRLGLDIRPAAPGIKTRDYLTWQTAGTAGTIHVVGNPPFGRGGALAVAFFNHSAGFAEVIAMILPASFAKASIRARLDPRFELVSELPLPGEVFPHEGRPHAVNAVFQVWRRSDRERARVRPVTRHPDFEFVGTKEEAHFAVRRVGGRAGAILQIPATPGPATGLSPSSNLFVKAVGCDPALLEARFQALDTAEVRSLSTAHPSVSKSDLVTLYEALLALERAAGAAGALQVRMAPVRNATKPAPDAVPEFGPSFGTDFPAPELAAEGDPVVRSLRVDTSIGSELVPDPGG